LKDTSGTSLRSADRIINYKFSPDVMVRTAGIADTFKVKTGDFNATFEGLLVSEVGPSEEQNRLDELDINILFQNEKIPYHYHKQYSSVNLIQRNPNALN
jgi:hypothetical protein